MSWTHQHELRDPAEIYERKEAAAIRKAQIAFEKARGFMTEEESLHIEELLETWFRHEDRYRPALSGPTASAYGRDYRTSETKRYGNDADDDRDAILNKITAEAVGACVDQLHYLQRAAINVHMRNKVTGRSVYKNPRIEDQHATYQAAKMELLPVLKQRGLVG